MKRRQILLDEESDRILEQLAQFHSGDRSQAIRATLKMHKTMQAMLDDLERTHAAELRHQKDRSEKSFRDGTAVPWDEVKRRCKL
jgi:hypothetical protein